MKKCFLIIGLLFFFSCKRACEPFGLNFYFENSQPTNDAELSKIPNKFQGLFMDSDSVFLNVKADVILKESFYKFKFHNEYIDSLKNEFIFSKGKCFSKSNNEVFDYRNLKDSIEFSKKRIDTFFAFSNTQKAKRFNGQLILNYKDSIYWKVKSIRLEKNVLKIKYFYSIEDLKRMDSLTKVKSTVIDSSSFIIKPSRKEFKSLLNLKKLGDELSYRKVKK